MNQRVCPVQTEDFVCLISMPNKSDLHLCIFMLLKLSAFTTDAMRTKVPFDAHTRGAMVTHT